MNNNTEALSTDRLALARPGAGQSHSPTPEDERVTEPLSSHRNTRSDVSGSENSPELDHASALQPNKCANKGLLSQIDLDCLSRGDLIVIVSSYSFYNFTVADPAIPSGKLTGGVLGSRLVDAELKTLEPGASGRANRSLKAGTRFTFLIDFADNLCELTTSRVTNLLHRKQGRRRRVPTDARIINTRHVSTGKERNTL